MPIYAAFCSAVFLLAQGFQERRYFLPCILPLRQRGIGRDVPCLSDELCPLQFALSAVVPDCTLCYAVIGGILFCRDEIHFYRHKCFCFLAKIIIILPISARNAGSGIHPAVFFRRVSRHFLEHPAEMVRVLESDFMKIRQSKRPGPPTASRRAPPSRAEGG